MTSSKLFHLSSSLLRFRRSINSLSFPPPPHHPTTSSHYFLPSRGSPVPFFHRLQFCTAASTAGVEGTEEIAAAPHPWPEWDQFVERIRSKGYFQAAPSKTLDDDDGERFPAALGSRGAAVDMNMLRNACLKFARERFDILRLLPKEDIRAVVECGCPNLFRKAVNSAKRLRAFLRLDEGEVCGACNIRGSCDRAYMVVHEEGARTVDLIRILLNYAVNQAALLGEESTPVKVQVQESAQKLLSELIKLSDTTIDQDLPKPIMNFFNQEDSSSQLKTTISKNKDLQNAEMKRGDWLCPNCNFLNFARNVCCLQCKVDGPKRVDSSAVEMKPGDWTCTKCDFMNFARNKKCFRCLEQRPKRDLNPGDWECPKCDFLNFSRNQVCRKCNCDRPSDEVTEARDHIWRKP